MLEGDAATSIGAACRVEVRLLGGFAVRIDGAEVPAQAWPSARAAQLVQLLSLADGHRLLRDQVIEALWPRLHPRAGAANLRKAAHYVRRALGRQTAIALKGGQVWLWPGAIVSVDAERFERLAASALAGGDAQACAEAAAAYGGELLPAARYEPWTDAARARLHGVFVAVLRAGAQWERLADVEPTDEPAHRALMQRELAAGNRAAAIRWYARLRDALQSTFGVVPDPATEALYERCVRGLLDDGPAFVGRHMELAHVAAWLRSAESERAGALLVRGPAGIGKSAFCRQIAALARTQGWRVVAVVATEPHRAYAVTSAAIERVLTESRSPLESVGEAARAVLALLSPLAGPAPPSPTPLGRHQVIGAFRRILLAASKGAPVLVLVDDAHLLGPADNDVMMHLAVTGRPVFVALGVRAPLPDAALARGLARLARGRHLLPIELGPLTDENAAELVERVAPRPLVTALRERVVRLAAGNPFAVIELARCMGTAPGAALPESAREAITARLCDVDDDVLSLLKSLALSGDEFDARTVVALAPGTEAEAFAALDRALAAGALVVADTRYRFRHELVRQALIEQVAPHQRLKAHRHAAQRLAQANAPPALVARHWLAGGSRAAAAAWLLQAAREAIHVGAYADALRQLEPLLAHDPAHVEGLRLRAEALDVLGDPAAVAAYRTAADAVGGTDAHDLRAKAALAQVKLGDPRGALRALEGVAPASVEGRLAEALAYSGAAALGVADPATGTRKAAEARRLALQTGDKAAIVVASWAQAAAAHARGELHGSVWADLHETHHVPHLAVRVFDGQLCIMQRFLYGARPYSQVISFADALAAEAQRLGAARGHAYGVTLRGEAELLSGDLDAAEEHLALGARLHHAFGGATGEAFALQRLSEVALYRGQRDLALARLSEALDLARDTDIGFHLLDRIYGTRIALGASPEEAFAALEDAHEAVRGPLETCPGCRITFAVPAAIAAARARRLDWVARYERAVEYLASVVMRLPAWYAALQEVRGHVARARGMGNAVAAAHFAAAARGFREADQPLDAARCDALAAGAP